MFKAMENKGFKEESRTKFGVDAIGMFTTPASNKSHAHDPFASRQRWGALRVYWCNTSHFLATKFQRNTTNADTIFEKR
jgi:hypothetical protein